MNAVPVGPVEFYAPERLWAMLALPILLVLYLIAVRFKNRRGGIRYTNTGIVAAVMPKQSQWIRHVAVLMTLASLTMITGAWARPVGIEEVPRERATIVVVLDTSQSMQAVDVKPNRLAAEKAAAKEFVNKLPAAYNVALVTLSGSPSVLVPPSLDRVLLNRAIDLIELQDGTAIGEAIVAALSAIAQAPASENDSKPAPALIVLLSDGQNTGGQLPSTAAAAAKEKNVAVHTIAFGTENGYVDLDGRRENVAPDRTTLRLISQETGGKALDAKDARQLEGVYKEIGTDIGTEEVRKEVTARWALYALAFAVVASLGAVSMATRWP